MTITRHVMIRLALGVTILLTTTHSNAGSAVFVGQRTSASVDVEKVDHSAWDRLLKRYVDQDGAVNYSSWHASASDRQALAGYLNSLSRADIKQSSPLDARLAFWINAYNAVTVHGILREYPTSSIRNHTARVFGYNIWHDLLLYVASKPYSLDTIEHQILRRMDEPRIHFAIVCASIGCPRLLNEAYSASRVQHQLEANAKDFFSRSQNFHHDTRAQRFYLSSILSWFADDFGENHAARLKTISRWLPAGSVQTARTASVQVTYLEYNWDLNDQKSSHTSR